MAAAAACPTAIPRAFGCVVGKLAEGRRIVGLDGGEAALDALSGFLELTNDRDQHIPRRGCDGGAG